MSEPSISTAEQLRLFIHSQTDYAMFVLDPQGHVRTWNAGAERIKGYRPAEIIGRHFSVFYPEDAITEGKPALELEVAAQVGRYEDEGWRVRKDGSQFWASVMVTALRDDAGALVGFGKTTRDLTSRRLAEEQLRATARELADANAELEQFRLLVASVRDYAIFMLDAGGHIRTWNAGAEAIKGYTETEIVGRHFSTFYTEDDRARSHPAHELEIAARDGRFEEEGWRVRKDGTTFWANVVITALRNDHGTLVGFAKVTRDLTERRAAEERLRDSAAELARSNTELERFAAAAAHDLAEPLQTIAGFADVVQRRYADRLDEQGVGFLAQVSGGAERMRRMIDGLLRYARATQHDMRVAPVDVAGVLATVLDNLAGGIAERDAAVVFDAEALPQVRADPDLLVSVLQNLIGNALKFAGDEPPRVEVSAARDVGLCRITVADNGIGIAPEHQSRIFQMFARISASPAPQGVGLGLALCERLVTRMGGTIGVDSAPGAGSRFWFTLPAASPATELAATSATGTAG